LLSLGTLAGQEEDKTPEQNYSEHKAMLGIVLNSIFS
jgi:hypothetical protein